MQYIIAYIFKHKYANHMHYEKVQNKKYIFRIL